MVAEDCVCLPGRCVGGCHQRIQMFGGEEFAQAGLRGIPACMQRFQISAVRQWALFGGQLKQFLFEDRHRRRAMGFVPDNEFRQRVAVRRRAVGLQPALQIMLEFVEQHGELRVACFFHRLCCAAFAAQRYFHDGGAFFTQFCERRRIGSLDGIIAASAAIVA